MRSLILIKFWKVNATLVEIVYWNVIIIHMCRKKFFNRYFRQHVLSLVKFELIKLCWNILGIRSFCIFLKILLAQWEKIRLTFLLSDIQLWNDKRCFRDKTKRIIINLRIFLCPSDLRSFVIWCQSSYMK